MGYVPSCRCCQDDLHQVLDRVRALGLELMDVRQTPEPLWGLPDDELPS